MRGVKYGSSGKRDDPKFVKQGRLTVIDHHIIIMISPVQYGIGNIAIFDLNCNG
jgi:hypothetical protein